MSGKIKSNENIQVYVRCRPINSRERNIHSQEMVKVSSDREVIVKQTIDNRMTKKFTFDRAFGPDSKQSEVYHVVVAPLINEVLAGYNCTVFAYGQTGTGKTHTMVGDESPQRGCSYEDSSAMGIIPRALSHLFEELRSMELEFSMRISYLELYNEELCDLLSSSEVTQIRIFEDPNKKGSIIVQGLEEIPVHSTADVYKLLAKGQEKRKMAATLMNAQSSRSHTVFSILVHIKENGIDGEELMKIGKLNLVDLAGSENISKAGNEKGIRTRETVNINQSLLTLGRVITALVERTPHVPYRESKLTRLLQESLGGRTKTSIIATISPGHKDLEETMSTLEYANRAKNIQNKPEVNQKLTKKTVLKEYTEEIDRLKRDLMAARDKNGVYLAEETYNQMQYQIDSQNSEITEQITKLKAQKEELVKRQQMMNEISVELDKKTEELKDTENALTQTNEILDKAKRGYQEKKQILIKHMKTEEILTKQARQLIDVANTATQDINQLHATIARRKDYDYNNVEACKTLDVNMNTHFSKMASNLKTFASCFKEIASSLIKKMDFNTKQSKTMYTTSISNLRMLIECEEQSKAIIDGHVAQSRDDFTGIFSKHSDETANMVKVATERRTEFSRQLEELQSYLNQTFTQFDQDIVRLTALVTENNNTVTTFCDSISNDMQTNADNVIEQLKNYRQTLDKTYNSNDELSKNMENLMEQFKSLISQSRNNNDKIKTVANLLESDETRINQELGDNLKNIDSFKVKMTNEITSMGTKLSECDQSVKSINSTTVDMVNVNKTNEKLSADCLTELQTIFNTQKNSLADCIDDVLVKVVDQCEMTKIDLSGGLQSVINDIVIEQERINTNKDEFDDVIQNLEMTQTEYQQMLGSDIDICSQRLDQFQTNELQIYKPSGQTPSKRDYVYPKALATTSPHAKIIKEFWRNHNPDELNCSAIDVIPEESKVEESTIIGESMNTLEESDLSAFNNSTAERTLCESRLLNLNSASTPIFPNMRKMVPMQNVSNVAVVKPIEEDKEN